MLFAVVQQLTYLKPYPRLYWDQLPSAGRLLHAMVAFWRYASGSLSAALAYLNFILSAEPHVSWIIPVCMKNFFLDPQVLGYFGKLGALVQVMKVLGMRYHHDEHCKALRWFTVFAKSFLHVFFCSDVDL